MPVSDVVHTQGPLDGSLYARVRKKNSLDGTLPVTGHASLPAVDHTLSVSSDSGNSTASIKTDRTDEHSQSVQSTVNHNNPTAIQTALSPQEKRELDQLLSGLEAPIHQQQAYLSTSTSPGGGVRHLVPAQVHVNGGHTRLVGVPSTEERETDILDDELPNSQEGNSVDSLGTVSSLEGQATPADLYYHSQTPVSRQGNRTYLERGVLGENLSEMPVHGVRTPTAMQERSVDSSQRGYYHNGGGIYHSQSFGNPPASSPETNPKLMPRAPERSTSSREAVQRGLNAWHQYSLPDDPFGPPLQSTHSLPHFPTSASQRDIEQSIEALNMLMLDLDPISSHMSKSHSAPTGENSLNSSQVPFSQTLARPSYQADSTIHGYNNSGSVNNAFHQPQRSTGRVSTLSSQSPVMESPVYSPQRPNAGYQHQNTTPTHTPEPHLHSRQQAPLNASSSPLPALTPQPKDTSSSSLAREQDAEEETLNLEGLVAHRIAGVRSRGMTPEVTQEIGRRRTTSEGQYQSNRDNTPAVHSQDFANNMALNPGGRPREKCLFHDRIVSSEGTPSHPHRPNSPEGSQVNIMGVHTVPGSPNTLHRTVATNTPPSPALQRRLGQASPSLSRHPSPAGVTSSPLIGQNPKTAAAGVPPSPLMGTPDELGAASRQGSAQPHSTPAFPISPQMPEKRHMSSGDAERTDNKNATAASGGSTPNLSGTHMFPDVSKSIYDGYPDIKMNVKFVQDTSKFWYKPDISREQAINLLKDREPGAFIIRDSHSFRGAYGLAMKVACPPPTVQQNKKVGDISNELVRHFLIETSSKGVRLKGCPNEPYFGCLSALVYQHSMTPLALPCKLMIPTKDPNDEALELATPTDQVEFLKQGAACNVLYINSVDMESLTGPQAIAKAISQTLVTNPLPAATTVHFKVSAQGVTLTDSQRKIFFRRHYPINTVTYCDTDPQDRKWGKEGGGSLKLFGFVARKQGSTTDNVSHLFAELDPDQPASAIVSFVSKMMKR
uniref:SH2 domain-containing protein n=1 Tax=Monopterus albus TaxID=43700 RepID=A0A3Q3IJ81_MONAL